MTQFSNYEYFPYFPSPPPTIPPPPPSPEPLTPPKVLPPYPPTPTVKPPFPPSVNPPPPPNVKPPVPPSVKPPSPSIKPPPPPSVKPPPLPPHNYPPPPASPSGHHPTVIIVIFVSVGGILFLAFLAAAFFCFVKRRNKRVEVQEIDKVKIDEHLSAHEDTVPGPNGSKMVVLTIEEDLHMEEEIKKSIEKSSFAKSGKSHGHVAGSTDPSLLIQAIANKG